ncbi:acyltransferase family protein [Pontibacter sp. JH31]|uniref:Acyltransferase family protein n=1 Tax=Pontibacter aquaedesilientis TaxID=2766980 RepID=A0ABR7XCU8_9BACT|nr:acyltransferase family protein [Pontibacter aquaedesilientis]MBD1396130.1 acyltransferase family protein [Pontibacter aquaedesilientis]
MKQHFQQIDLLKGLAIIAVILLHSLSKQELIESFAVFHIWQAVPLFMVIMGFNLGLSYSGKTLQFRHLYTLHYFQKKAIRIIFPLLLLYVIAIGAGHVWQQLYGEEIFTLGWENFIGVLPVSGKGNYFITLLLQSILLLPLIGYTFHRKPYLTIATLIALEIAFLIISFQFAYFDENRYLYDAAFFRYLSAIALGMWLARLASGEQPRVKWFVILSGLASALYLYIHQYQGVSLPYIRPEWQAQLVLTFPYATLLIYLAILLFPQRSDNQLFVTMAQIGKASYHIFLVQVLYFGLMPEGPSALANLAFCLAAGYAFFLVESWFSEKITS